MTEQDGLRDALVASLGSDYRIERELGGGGMSRVFVARDQKLDRDVVIKVLSPDLAHGLSHERFMREVRLAASLQEPHIVPVHSAGITPTGLPYYVMAYMRGDTLRARIAQEQLPVAECIGILRDIARALSYAHRQGVIHRDIKPENVLLSFGSAVVSDFGIAKAISASRVRNSGENALTSVGISLGTPAYMSPEQAAGDSVDARSDLYAWGVIAYEMLTGQHPFAGPRTNQQYIAAHLAEQPVPLVLKLPRAPVALSDLVMRCLEKEPARRPVAATELVRILQDTALMTPPKTVEEEPPAVGITPRRFLVGLITAGLVAAFVFGGPYMVARYRLMKTKPPSIYVTDGTPLTTLAVLPFANIGGDPQNEYFTDGMTDELAHALAGLPDIKVAGRTSSYVYKGKPVNALEVGKILNVGGVVTGSIQRVGNRLRVGAELVNANDGLVVWSDRYDRPAADVFAVQDELTRRIVEAITPKLRGTASSSVAQENRGTRNNEAYDFLMRGRYHFARRGADNLAVAISSFQQAIAKDPRFARAHAYLAMAHGVLPAYAATNVDSMAALSLAEAKRALMLDSSSADAHIAMGVALAPYSRFVEAVAHLSLGVKGLPGDATARQWYGETLASLGRMKEARDETQRAVELDPLSPTVRFAAAFLAFSTRRFDEALSDIARIRSMDSSVLRPRVLAAMTLALTGRADSAIKEINAVIAHDPLFPGIAGVQVLAFAAAGRWTDAARVRASIQRRRPQSDYDVFTSAVVFGDVPEALTVLEQSATHASDIASFAGSLPCEPTFDPIRAEPRFLAYVELHGMKQCPVTTPWLIVRRPRRVPPPVAP